MLLTSTINQLFDVDFRALVIGIAVIAIAWKAIVTLVEWFLTKYGIETKSMREKRNTKDMIAKMDNAISELKSKEKNDREEFSNVNRNLKSDIDGIRAVLDQIQCAVKDIQLRTDEDEKAKLKDRISQGYRFYSARRLSDEKPIPYWTKREKEALVGLIGIYEDHGGTNSFVHSLVEPEMLTWEVISEQELHTREKN